MVERAYRTYGSLGYGYECTEFTQVPGMGINVVQNSQTFHVRYGCLTERKESSDRHTNVSPVPCVLWHGRTTELPEVLGTGV